MPPERSRLPLPIEAHALREVEEIVMSLPLSQRKDMMTILRVGAHPRRSSRLRRKLHTGAMSNLPVLVQIAPNRVKPLSWYSVLDAINPFLQTAVGRSILSSLLRSVPLVEGKADGIVEDSIAKEICVTQRTDLYPTLQYPFFYDRQTCYEHRMHSSYPRRDMAMVFIRSRLIRWRDSFSKTLLYPQTSRKLLGVDSSRALDAELYWWLKDYNRPSRMHPVSDLERFYADEGREIDGPCEVRFAWKFNDLKPRVYYGIGATAYANSKYIWSIFDSLQRQFRCSDPKER
jgi:hypothetical protein